MDQYQIMMLMARLFPDGIPEGHDPYQIASELMQMDPEQLDVLMNQGEAGTPALEEVQQAYAPEPVPEPSVESVHRYVDQTNGGLSKDQRQEISGNTPPYVGELASAPVAPAQPYANGTGRPVYNPGGSFQPPAEPVAQAPAPAPSGSGRTVYNPGGSFQPPAEPVVSTEPTPAPSGSGRTVYNPGGSFQLPAPQEYSEPAPAPIAQAPAPAPAPVADAPAPVAQAPAPTPEPIAQTPAPAQEQTTVMPTQPANTWEDIAKAYGLGAPPAEGLPSTLPGVTVGAPPQMQTDMGAFDQNTKSYMDQFSNIFDYDTPQMTASQLDMQGLPELNAQQYGESPELKQLLSGQGYAPGVLAKMKANATENSANTGLQQLMQMKSTLGDRGISGPAAGAYRGAVARETGYDTGRALNDIDTQNAQVGNENMKYGAGLQANIGLSNMAQANQMALQKASQIFQAMRENMNASNQTAQFNTGNQVNQKAAGANAQAGFLGQQGQQRNAFQHENEQTNNQNAWQGQQQQTAYDWDKQRLPWQELNNRNSEASQVLGAWGNG